MPHDNADWHSGGDYPDDLPAENAGTHIGMFLAWAIANDLHGEYLRQEAADAIAELQARNITGRDLLFEVCDGQLAEECLNDEGNAFADKHYDKYFGDYAEAQPDDLPSAYHFEDTWENYDLVAPSLDRRYEKWSRKAGKRFRKGG